MSLEIQSREKVMSLDTPEGRLAYIEANGLEAYNRAMKKKFDQDTVEIVNGHRIRTVHSRFGLLYVVDGTNKAHSTLEGARAIARGE